MIERDNNNIHVHTDTRAEVTAPTVNLNGDRIETLLTQQQEIAEACAALMRKIAEAAPHGRNFQTAPDGDYEKARKQWENWADLVTAINNDVSEVYQKLYNQKRD